MPGLLRLTKMKKIFFNLLILFSILISAWLIFSVFNEINAFQLILYCLLAFFLVVFGVYGLYAEMLWKKFRKQGKTENLCVEASYYAREKGFLGKVFLFPFIKIKSSNSVVVSFLGALAWVIIVSVFIKVFFG